MNLFNNAITRRTNKLIRNKIKKPFFKKKVKRDDWTVICNNCVGGMVTNDFGHQFRSPTINLFFPQLSFFDFVENMDYYLEQPIENAGENTDIAYPIGVLKGDGIKPDILLHFMHYKSFDDAKEKWNSRKKRINKDNLFVVWTFSFRDYTEEDYKRFNMLPVKKKVGFVNRKELCETYGCLYYIKGFEKQNSLGNITDYSDFLGSRYYDQFDFAKWFNE